MRILNRIGSWLVLSVPACAYAGPAVTEVSEPSLVSLLALGGIVLALYSKFRKK
jgi:hypothetical protein